MLPAGRADLHRSGHPRAVRFAVDLGPVCTRSEGPAAGRHDAVVAVAGDAGHGADQARSHGAGEGVACLVHRGCRDHDHEPRRGNVDDRRGEDEGVYPARGNKSRDGAAHVLGLGYAGDGGGIHGGVELKRIYGVMVSWRCNFLSHPRLILSENICFFLIIWARPLPFLCPHIGGVCNHDTQLFQLLVSSSLTKLSLWRFILATNSRTVSKKGTKSPLTRVGPSNVVSKRSSVLRPPAFPASMVV